MLQVRDVKEQFAVEQNISFLKVQNLWEERLEERRGGGGNNRALEMTIDAAGSPDTIYFRRTPAFRDGIMAATGGRGVDVISAHAALSPRRLKAGDHSGKVIATLGPDQRFMAETPLRPSAVAMNTRATYVVTGGTRGTRGIGLELAYWLIDHGVKYIVLLGRSGAQGQDVQKLLKRYKEADVTIRALACNVGRREELAQVMESIKDLPAVKGVDKLFMNATYEDWEINTMPRVKGAWNLDELMPADLDFFIALSSFSGDTENMGQVIYAGTAGFYDAFARYRNKRGQYTVSIVLPVVLDVGYAAEHNMTELLKMALGASVTMADIRALFQGAVSGSLADAPLGSYNLDSLVSVELRNWIRRETTVELTLSAIMQADSLRALATEILAWRKTE
ncbi:Highly reducing polyketide synthase ACRTS2 [Apiospora sp. TS-2023a]